MELKYLRRNTFRSSCSGKLTYLKTLTWNIAYATHVRGRLQLIVPILKMSIPHVLISFSIAPNVASCGVSTPNAGKRSLVNEFVCMSGRLKPDICDIVRGERLRYWLLETDDGFGWLSNDWTSTSCCLSI